MRIDKLKLIFWLSIAFMFFTVVGTLTHELGHIAVAKFLGYETELHFGSMNHYPKGYKENKNARRLKFLAKEYKKSINNNLPFKDVKELEKLHIFVSKDFPINKKHSIFIVFGGPLQTLLTSILGLILLQLFNSKNQINYRFKDWLAVFLSLFALREVFNFITSLFSSIFFETKYFSGDEFKISRYFELNQWIIPVFAFLIGIVICVFVIFKMMPIKYRKSFVIAGFFGGLFGFYFWFFHLGKILLP